jgi:hypothetical protein
MNGVITLNFKTISYQVRTEQRQGRGYWILPVVMLVEGVHNGSRGAVLHTKAELSDSVSRWNGQPIVVDHPKVSANDEGTIKVGVIENARMEGEKLKADLAIDIEKLREHSEETYNILSDGRALEVSTGYFSEFFELDSEWNNIRYTAIATHIQPDHLALLPHDVGACSIDDGCGIRNKENMTPKEKKERQQRLIKNILDVKNQEGFKKLIETLQGVVNGMDTSTEYYFLEEVFEDNFIYQKYNRDSGEVEYYSKSYTKNEDGTVKISEEATRVNKEINYTTAINNNYMNTNAACSVDALIKNKATKFTDSDQEWLSKLSEDQLKKLEPVANAEQKTIPFQEGDESKQPEKVDNTDTLREQMKQILNEESDPEKFADSWLPKEVAQQIKTGLSTYRNQKKQLIEGIANNSEFTKEELEPMEINYLSKLHQSLNREEKAVSVFLNSSYSDGNIDEEEASAMLGFEPKKTA